MPKLWNETIEAHRRDVRDAILQTAWELVTTQGRSSVTMSRIAEATGIGRATLYKYFPDVDSMLVAWHQRHMTAHLERLSAIRDNTGDPWERLARVLRGYARICHQRAEHGADLVSLLHRGADVVETQQKLLGLVEGLLAEVAAAGALRTDTPPGELARFCLHALTAAGGVTAEDAVDRLIAVTMAGLKPV